MNRRLDSEAQVGYVPIMTNQEKTAQASIFTVHAPGVDVEALVREIQETVDRKMADGVYADARVARAERANLTHLQDEDQFLEFYLRCLRDVSLVDISDYEIRERRRGLAPLLVRFKKTIWSLLKFYTYRLWSQQNQVNGLIVTAVETMDRKYSERIRVLEARVRELENLTADRQQDEPQNDDVRNSD